MKIFNNISKKWKSSSQTIQKVIKRRPMVSFFAALGLLLLLLLAVRIAGTPRPETETVETEPKSVMTYTVGAAPTITVQGQVEKTGTVTVMAQTAGVVQSIKVSEGDVVKSKQVVVSLSTTYGGANSASVQRQIAAKTYENAKATYDTQVALINQRKELAVKTDENADELNELAEDTLDRSREQLALNEEILEIIDRNLQTLESTLPAQEELILAAKQQKAQALAAVNGLEDAVDNLEYSTDSDNAPQEISNLTRDIAIKGLEVEEKSLQLSLEVSQLNLRLAQINEAIYFPQSPFAGTVERVFVKPGQLVQPGAPLLTLSGTEQSVKVVALVSQDVAKRTSRYETSRLYIGQDAVDQVPQYVATEPTDGNLYAVTWCQLDQYTGQLSDKEYVRIDLAVGYQNSLSATPFLPIDSVYQTQDEAYVFVVNSTESDTVVESKPIKLGIVYGNFVQIEEGVQVGDEVVLDRTVVAGDKVVRL